MILTRNYLASGGEDNKVIIWDLVHEKGVMQLNDHSKQVQVVRWNKGEENILLTGSFDRTIKLFDARQNTPALSIVIPSDVEAAEWHPTDKFIFGATFESGYISLFDMRKNTTFASFKGHFNECTDISFSKEQNGLFVTGSRDCTVKVWDAENLVTEASGDISATLLTQRFVKTTNGKIQTCKFADDVSYTVAAGGTQGDLFIWQIEEDKNVCARYGLKWQNEEDDDVMKQKMLKNRIKFRKNKK